MELLMKNIKNIIPLMFLALNISLYPSQSVPEAQNTQEIAEQIDKKISLLDQIMAQASIIADSSNKTMAVRAKKELTRLMQNPTLSIHLKDMIKDDIQTIKTAKTSTELTNAYQRLLDTYEKINAKAFTIETIIEATEMVKNASPENLQETITQAQQKIKDAQQEEQGLMGRVYSKVKRFVTTPVDYVFGKEESYAKTAFYAAVGLAVVAASTYGMLRYLNISQYNPLVEKKDHHLDFLDKMIETSSHSRKNASINERYANEVAGKSKYQIEKYVHEREKQLRQELKTSDDKKTVENQLYALKEFQYFYFDKHWVPGDGSAYDTTILLRDEDNLSNNSPYLLELTDEMLGWGGGKISLAQKEQGKFDSVREAVKTRQEFLRTLHEYSQLIHENEQTLAEKVKIAPDKLYKAGLSNEQLKKIAELEKSMKKPFFQRLLSKYNPYTH